MSQPYQPSTSPVSNTPVVNPFIPPQQNINPTNATNQSSGSQSSSTIINPTPMSTNPTTSTIQQSSSSSLISQKSDNNLSKPQQSVKGRFRIVSPTVTTMESSNTNFSINTLGEPTLIANIGDFRSEPQENGITDTSNPTNKKINKPKKTITVQQTPISNVPIESYVGETDKEYVIFFRAIQGTRVNLKLEGKTLIIVGLLPSIPTVNIKGLSLLEKPNVKFEQKIIFPTEIDLNAPSKEILRESCTMIIKIKKFPKVVDIGDEVF